MRFRPLLLAALLTAGGAADASAEDGDGSRPQTEAARAEAEASVEAVAAYGEVDVEGLVALIEAGTVTVFDANRPGTRARYGVVPGAVLLPSHEYDASTVLASVGDDTLVFYCANPRCTASDRAAEVALAAGFGDVRVLRAGIMGWVEAGQAVDTVE